MPVMFCRHCSGGAPEEPEQPTVCGCVSPPGGPVPHRDMPKHADPECKECDGYGFVIPDVVPVGADPDCPHCKGEGVVGEWDRCSKDVPICVGGALGGIWSCTCDGGLPERYAAWVEARGIKEGRYLFEQTFERISLLEGALCDILKDAGGGDMSAAMVALEALEISIYENHSHLRRRALIQRKSRGSDPWWRGHDAGYAAGVRHTIEAARRRFQGLRWPDKNPTTPGTLRLWNQLEMFGELP